MRDEHLQHPIPGMKPTAFEETKIPNLHLFGCIKLLNIKRKSSSPTEFEIPQKTKKKEEKMYYLLL